QKVIQRTTGPFQRRGGGLFRLLTISGFGRCCADFVQGAAADGAGEGLTAILILRVERQLAGITGELHGIPTHDFAGFPSGGQALPCLPCYTYCACVRWSGFSSSAPSSGSRSPAAPPSRATCGTAPMPAATSIRSFS